MNDQPMGDGVTVASASNTSDLNRVPPRGSPAAELPGHRGADTFVVDHGRPEEMTLPPSNTNARAGETPAPRMFGDYELIEEIARGGMGVVYKARQKSLNRTVALKMILAGQLAGKDDVQRFYAEAEAAASLDHPGIVPIYEVGQEGEQHYFSMAYVDGGSLAALIKDGPLPPQRATEYVEKVSRAIAFAHERGVIHRDLKPGNVLLDRHGEPKVTDFGLAKKVQGGSELTSTGQILGTPSYMPPEQAAGKIAEVGPAADVYSLGAILYALITGRPPFQADNPLDTLLQVLEREPIPPRQLNPKLPADLETICLKCLEKAPARRYGSAAAVAKELSRFLAGEPIVARPITTVERGWRWCRRKPVVASLATTIALLVVVGTSVATFAAFRFRKLAAQERQTAANEAEARRKADAASQAATSARKAAEASQKSAEHERNLARAAQEQSLDTLAASLYQQAVAVRSSARPGRRGAALDLLKKSEALRARKREVAAEAVTGSEQSPPENSLPARSDLRSEAVAALLMSDARLVWERVLDNPGIDAGLNPRAERAIDAWADISAASAFDENTSYDEALKASRGVRLINLADGSHVPLPKGHQMWGTAIALSPDGQSLAVCQEIGLLFLKRRGIALWDLQSSKVIRTLDFPSGTAGDERSAPTRQLAFSPDGKFLVALGMAFRKSHVVVWNLESGAARSVEVVRGETFCFSHDSAHLAHQSDRNEITLWKLDSDEPPVKFESPLVSVMRITFCPPRAFSSGGEVLAMHGPSKAAGERAELVLWNVKTNSQQGSSLFLPQLTGIFCMAFNSAGNQLACADSSHNIHVFNVRSRRLQPAYRIESAHAGLVRQLAWKEDSSQLWSMGGDGALKCWEFSKPAHVTTVLVNTFAGALAMHPTKRQEAIVPRSTEPHIHLVNLDNGEVEQELKSKAPSKTSIARRLVFSPDASQLALIGSNLAVAWNLVSGEEVARVEADGTNLYELSSLSFATEGRLLASALAEQYGNKAVIIDAISREKLFAAPNPRLRIELSPDGNRFALTSRMGDQRNMGLEIWDLPTKHKTVELQQPGGQKQYRGDVPQFSPSGQWLAAIGGRMGRSPPGQTSAFGLGSAAAYLAVWKLPEPQVHLQIRGSSAPAAYAFSADSAFLAVGLHDGAVELWDLNGGQLVFRWKCLPSTVSQLMFASDTSALVAASSLPSGLHILDLAGLRRDLADYGLDW